TPAAKGEMEEEAASSGGMAPALSPTPSAGSRQEVLEARKPFGGERPEGGREPLPPNLAASTMGQAGKADEGSLRNGTEDDWTQHRISLYVLRSVHNEPANADTLTSEEQDADHEEDTHVRTAVGTNSGPDLLNGTYATPADATTATPAFNRDQTIVRHKDNV
ncbi:putative trans-sialidase, partial [Trypanosoma cruzi]